MQEAEVLEGHAAAPAPARSRALVITVLGLTQIMAWGSSYYLIAVLARPIAADTGWALSWVVGGLSLGMLCAAAVSQRVGHAIHRHGGRPVLAASAIILAAGLVGLAMAQSLAAYLAAWVVLGVGMGAGLYDPAFAALGRLYGADARRAISTLTLFGGFASTVCWPLSAFMVEHLGWRGACLAYAAVQVFASLPLLMIVLPRAAPALPAGEGGARVLAAQDAARDRRELRLFVWLASILMLGWAITSLVAVHLLTLLQAGHGLDLVGAVALGALVGPSQVAARLTEMALGGRLHAVWTLMASVAFVALGLVTLASGLPVIAAAIVGYGAGSGLHSIARGSLPLALFGPSRYAIWMGRVATPTLAAGALSPSAGAVLIEWIGPQGAVNTLATLALVNVLLTAMLAREVLR